MTDGTQAIRQSKIAEIADVPRQHVVRYRLLNGQNLCGDKPFDVVHWRTPRFEVFALEEEISVLRGFVVGFAGGDIDYRVAPQRHGVAGAADGILFGGFRHRKFKAKFLTTGKTVEPNVTANALEINHLTIHVTGNLRCINPAWEAHVNCARLLVMDGDLAFEGEVTVDIQPRRRPIEEQIHGGYAVGKPRDAFPGGI